MNDEEFGEFLSQSLDELEEKQEEIERNYGVGHHERFVANYEEDNLLFFENERPVVEAKILQNLEGQVLPFVTAKAKTMSGATVVQ